MDSQLKTSHESSEFSVHPSAIVDAGAQIGSGTRIWHWVHISGGAKIGKNCVFGQNVFVGNKVLIGNNVKVQNNVSIYDSVSLEDDVFCGPSMVFTNVINPRSAIERKNEYLPTLVKRGATLGANCTIVCGVTIGEFSFIGAGAVVTKNVPAYALIVGNPGRRMGWMGEHGVRLVSNGKAGEWRCPATNILYREIEAGQKLEKSN